MPPSIALGSAVHSDKSMLCSVHRTLPNSQVTLLLLEPCYKDGCNVTIGAIRAVSGRAFMAIPCTSTRELTNSSLQRHVQHHTLPQSCPGCFSIEVSVLSLVSICLTGMTQVLYDLGPPSSSLCRPRLAVSRPCASKETSNSISFCRRSGR